MNTFQNREDELALLDRLYAEPDSKLVVLYGRRRLGKTTLLGRFAESKPCIYYMADKAAEVSQRNALARAMSSMLDEPILEQAGYSEWYDLFAAFDRLRDRTQKTILILDEYQYLCQTQRAFSSLIQKWWDEHWKQDNVMLILCGSLTSMMYRETLSHSSPLYGRSDASLLLRPLPYQHVRAFLPAVSEKHCVERYALCGGVPRYLELLAPFKTFDEALTHGILAPSAPLHAEARYLLQDEIDVPNVCWSLLEAIASGATRISEMASRLQQPANSLTRYLSLLRDLSIVERSVPVAEKNPSRSKRGVYNITDPFLRLWFGCIYPYESHFEFAPTPAAMAKLRPQLDHHIQHCYEALCRHYTRDYMMEESVRIGRQWGAHYEIDVACVNEQGEFTLLGECKWSTRKVGMSVLHDLQQTASRHALPLAPKHRWLLFSRSGFTKELTQHANTTPTVQLITSLFPTNELLEAQRSHAV